MTSLPRQLPERGGRGRGMILGRRRDQSYEAEPFGNSTPRRPGMRRDRSSGSLGARRMRLRHHQAPPQTQSLQLVPIRHLGTLRKSLVPSIKTRVEYIRNAFGHWGVFLTPKQHGIVYRGARVLPLKIGWELLGATQSFAPQLKHQGHTKIKLGKVEHKMDKTSK